MRSPKIDLIDAALLAAAVWLAAGLWREGGLPIIAPASPDAAVYVYEKDQTAPPSGVKAAIDEIQRGGEIRASLFEKDTTNGSGETPEQYRAPLAAAQESEGGLPAFVVMAGEEALRIVSDPQSKAECMEAIR